MNITNDSGDAGSLRRGVAILKLLATSGSRGLALTELAARASVPHPTVHRVLKQLMAENLATHNTDTKRYRLGPLAFELGLACSTMYDIRDICTPFMDTLAEMSGDTAYLVVRSGFEAVCIHRCEGNFPVRALVLEVGSRRPLGVGAGGLAILSAIDDAERKEVIARVAPTLPAFGKLDANTLEQACESARTRNAAIIQNRVTLGITAIGKPFRNSLGQPVGALSVAALTERMSAQHIRKIDDALGRAVKSVERKLSSMNTI
ncbi:IclR family transcriptional regulator [Paraburkholderia tropica]|uniref:IclR family transcriptional regulator n=1 Tax=Paraburkholderia tropica TaxID=92647 RepID=UPI002AB68409|nr:IclR family transcriptional regulator [Paraburkholderia tropica]